MKCPYCEQEMVEGTLRSQKIPTWFQKGEKSGVKIPVKKHFTYNETAGYYCDRCKKMIIDASF